MDGSPFLSRWTGSRGLGLGLGGHVLHITQISCFDIMFRCVVVHGVCQFNSRILLLSYWMTVQLQFMLRVVMLGVVCGALTSTSQGAPSRSTPVYCGTGPATY